MKPDMHAYDYPLSQGQDPVRVGELVSTLDALSDGLSRYYATLASGRGFPLTDSQLYRDHKLLVGLTDARRRIDEAAQYLSQSKGRIAIAAEDSVRSNMLATVVRETARKVRSVSGAIRDPNEIAAHIDLYRVCAENLVVLHLEALQAE